MHDCRAYGQGYRCEKESVWQKATSSESRLRCRSHRLGRFKKDFAERTTATVTSDEIDDWLNSLKDERTGENLSLQSRSNYARALGVAFSYAVKRKYARVNSVKEIERPTSDSKPGIPSVEQTARLLECASPEILPYIAIGAFAGLRASELERLDGPTSTLKKTRLR